ncbi:MAG: ATP-binding protein [Elusimicrobiota bacterium]
MSEKTNNSKSAYSRYINASLRSDLKQKMVFLGGPRQVGKTTLALGLLGIGANETHSAYLNWDDLEDRHRLLNHQLPSHESLLVLDEIHKYQKWRNLVKGLYDKNKSRLSILVTGSARLDFYRKGGDSLAGRYHFIRLHPFSLREFDPTVDPKGLPLLLKFGGFPEPLFRADETHHRRWLREHTDRILREDLRDLEQVREISLVEALVAHLPVCVGSPLSVGNLRNLLQVSHESVERWISILERLFVCFRIPPYGASRIRAVRKEQKLYFWDWSHITEDGPRFENLVASQLLKYCHWIEDTEGYRMELRFLRDTDRREVDFVVLRDNKPEFAVECKTGERSVSASAIYFQERTPIPVFYQVHLGEKDFIHSTTGIRVLPFATFCKELRMP